MDIAETRRAATADTYASVAGADADMPAAAIGTDTLVAATDSLAAAADADILAIVTLGDLLEVFFTFRPRLRLTGASAGEEDEPICFLASFCLRLGGFISAEGSV